MKTAKASVEQVDKVDDILVEIEGLTSAGFVNGREQFQLTGLKNAPVDYSAIENQLMDAGIDHGDAIHLTERFAEEVFQFTIAKNIARRLKRVG